MVAAALQLDVTYDPDLQEANFGAEEGRPMGHWYDDWVTGAMTPQGGEPFAALQARVVPAINRALAGDGLLLIVAHGALFRAVRAAMGLSALVRAENGVAMRCEPGKPWRISPVEGPTSPA